MCFLTALAYASSVSGGFLYEDRIVPESPRFVRGLTRASRALTGPDAFAARVVNVGWHLLNGWLLWLWARHVVTTAAALMATALFLLHPIQTETVAYIAARPELITAMWVLLACLCAQRGWLWIAAVCAGLALTGKEMGVMAWLLVPLAAWVGRATWGAVPRDLWMGAAILTGTLFTAEVVTRGLGAWMPWTFYGAQLMALCRLLWLLPQSLWNTTVLTIDHDWAWMTRTHAALALVTTPLLVAVAIRTSRIAAFALGWTLVALAPRLLIPLPDGLHERHLYLAMPALCLLGGAALFPRTR